MHNYITGMLITGLMVFSASSVDAQRVTNKEMHDRINALRSRLQNYQLERVREEPRKAVLADEKETVEVRFEELVENFESRKDVAVTVLFHDEDFAKSTETDNSKVADIENKQMLAAFPEDTKTASLSDQQEQADNIDAMQQLELERVQRHEKYEALRRRVQMATRRTRNQAMEINDMVAQVP